MTFSFHLYFIRVVSLSSSLSLPLPFPQPSHFRFVCPCSKDVPLLERALQRDEKKRENEQKDVKVKHVVCLCYRRTLLLVFNLV